MSWWSLSVGTQARIAASMANDRMSSASIKTTLRGGRGFHVRGGQGGGTREGGSEEASGDSDNGKGGGEE